MAKFNVSLNSKQTEMMKKFYFLGIASLMVFMFSCSDDDDNAVDTADPDPTTPVQVTQGIVINELSYIDEDWVEFTNQSTEAVDISTYVLCTGPGSYKDVASLEAVVGETTIPAGGFLVVKYELANDGAGVGLYTPTTDFTDENTLVDFVQYGKGGTSREDVAVRAGIWTAGDFIPLVENQSYTATYDGSGNASSDWSEAVPSPGK